MANKQLNTRLTALEAKRLPGWDPVLTISADPAGWDQAVKDALQAAPTPPPGAGYLVVPERCRPDEWEAIAKAEMSQVRRHLGLDPATHE